MNESPSFSEAATSASGTMTPGSAAPAIGDKLLHELRDELSQTRMALRRSLRAVYLALAVLAALLAALWISNRMAATDLRDETARRLKAGDVNSTETRVVVKTLSDTARELQAKVSVLESKQVESQSQQLALEQLYQDLSKNRDDWALAEIEEVLSTASQQLQLAGNVEGALIALQNADSRLSRSDKPQFIVIRRAIAHDIDRLKAVPSLDLTGIALRLDSIIAQVDDLPLLADEQPDSPVRPLKKAGPAAAGAAASPAARGSDGTPGPPTPVHIDSAAVRPAVADAGTAPGSGRLAVLEEKWHDWTDEMWSDIRQLIRVRSVAVPDALLLSPEQAYFARENLKLRLLNARLALLTRNESAFRSDVAASQEAITRYFDVQARQTQTALQSLHQVQGSNLAIELPNLSESLNAVRDYKAKP